MNYEALTKIHAKYEGVCQKCEQRCDKRVISVAKENGKDIILCPDCANGKERPIFKVGDDFVKRYESITKWDTDQIRAFLGVIPYGLALVYHNPNTRMYWNWDKSKHIHLIETDDDGNFLNMQLLSLTKKKQKKQVLKIQNKLYRILGNNQLNVNNIEIPDEFKKTSKPNPQKVESKIREFEESQRIEKPVYVARQGRKKYLLLDGYTTYLAVKKLKLRYVDVVIVGSMTQE